MRQLLLLAVGLGLSLHALAQVPIPIIVPKTKNFKPGRYQLSDGSWRAGHLYFEGGPYLEIRPDGEQPRTVFPPGDVTRFVIGADTFGVAHDVTLNEQWRLSRLFAQQLYRTPYHTVFYHQASATSSEPAFVGSFTIVQAAGGPGIRVPLSRRPFTEAMLPFFGACPELAEGIRRGKLGPQHVQRMAATFAKWRRENPAPADSPAE